MPTTTVETTCSAVKSTAGAATVAAPWTARKTASTVGCGAATVARASASVISRTIASAAVRAPTIASAAVIVPPPAAPAIISPIPRPGADEPSADKPVRPVVAVRRTGVRCISVVAVVAYGRSGNVSRPESDPKTDLGLGVGQWNHQNYQQGHIP